MLARLIFRFTISLLLGLGTLQAQTQTAQPAPAPSSSRDRPNLGQVVTALLQDEAVAHAHWGISVMNMDGTPVFELDAAKLFRPASTAKLFTTAAALALLGPDHRFTTTVRGALDAGGTVQGDLLLVGGGDPSFGSSDLPYQHATPAVLPAASPEDTLTDLVTQLASAGVHRVTGNVLGDDTLFEAATVPDGWAAEDLAWAYGTLPSALTFADNELEVTLSPSPRTSEPAQAMPAALLKMHQIVPWLQVTNQVVTRTSLPGEVDSVGVFATSKMPQGVRLVGSIAPDAAPVQEHLALSDSAAYAAAAFRSILLQQQVLVKGDARSQHRPTARPTPFLAGLRRPACEASLQTSDLTCVSACPFVGPTLPVLAEHRSAPLSEEIAFTLKTSANLHAELLLHHLGLQGACPGATTLQGVRVIRRWLLQSGLPQEEITLYDGSGLSTKDLVSPRAETRLLAYAATQPWFPQWFAALPVGGVDGTLSSRFTSAPLKGHIFAKTGTLGETRALAGYVDCMSGQRLTVAILVDNHQPGSSADRLTMDKIVAAIAENN